MSYSICLFSHFKKNLYLFKLFEQSKYKIIYKFENLWNFDSFQKRKILEIFGNFHIENFWNFTNSKFCEFQNLEFAKFQIFKKFYK